MEDILGTKVQIALSVTKINDGVRFKYNFNRELLRQQKKKKVEY